MRRLRDAMLEASDDIAPMQRPPRFEEAQDLVRSALAHAEAAGLPDITLAAVLIIEAIPRLAGSYGPEHAARILAMFAGCLEASVPSRQ
ncbi:hypothetical protein DW352_06710 [Pseudolabrys taiwanensis]|uniref:Uncharacterized protein n=1 Tax=Pseudolabrys taiwanensis TaxID=331696 RepID=A0A345ZTI9_9HYPH|nr:hypothetical protein [Pseudolabrys taiwanensis]AXK80236.1 hypothetical protein DW352_06710 [Pseudolabrys taiwanensis]